jgi:hypothetical protein
MNDCPAGGSTVRWPALGLLLRTTTMDDDNSFDDPKLQVRVNFNATPEGRDLAFNTR